MRLRALTVTGADTTTPLGALVELSAQYPFVEWGILLSPHAPGRPGCPDPVWLEQLASVAQPGMRVAAHLCGRWVLDASVGELPSVIDWRCFSRVQLNLGAYPDLELDPTVVIDALREPHEYVLQVGSRGHALMSVARELRSAGVDVSLLFDSWGGTGRLPADWPTPPSDVPCGFAGGLGPENLAAELHRLESVVGNTTIWVDMQRGVRGGSGLDLERVRRSLDLGAQYVGWD